MKYKNILPLMIIISFFVLNAVASAQNISKNEIKGAFIFNFVKHTTWPNKPKDQEIILAVYADSDFYESVRESFSNKKINGQAIQFLLSNNIEDIKRYHAVIIQEKFNDSLDDIAFALRKTDTLLITQNSISKKNVMINLVTSTKNNRLSFEVNKSNILYENLSISSELLLLGGTELDVAILYRETESAMQDIKKHENQMIANLALLKNQLEQNEQGLKEKKSELDELRLQTKKQQRNFLLMKEELAFKFEEKEQTLIKISAQKNKEILASQVILKNKIHEIEMRKSEITAMEAAIVSNQLKINRQIKKINNQQSEIITKDEHIKSRNTYLAITLILFFIASLFTVIIGVLFVRNRKTTKELQVTLNNLRKTQAQLVQSEKMASLGLLTAGVAHEMNTPLGIIVTSLSIIEDDIEALENKIDNNELSKRNLLHSLGEIKESTAISSTPLSRLVMIVNNFKQLADEHAYEERRSIDVKTYIDEIMNTLSRELNSKGISYEINGDKDFTIIVIPGSLVQVLTNLVTNAMLHAFSNDDSQQHAQITINLTKTNNDAIEIEFSDNGVGMDEIVLKNIYEPFYTTKRSKGVTGLGMNIVYNIVQQKLQGSMDIKSVLGIGTTVMLTLPVDITKEQDQ